MSQFPVCLVACSLCSVPTDARCQLRPLRGGAASDLIADQTDKLGSGPPCRLLGVLGPAIGQVLVLDAVQGVRSNEESPRRMRLIQFGERQYLSSRPPP